MNGKKLGRPRKTPEEEQFNARLGMLICETRKAKGVRATQLSRKLGVTHTALYLWEAGVNSISFYALSQICAILELSVADMVQAASYRCNSIKSCAQCLKSR